MMLVLFQLLTILGLIDFPKGGSDYIKVFKDKARADVDVRIGRGVVAIGVDQRNIRAVVPITTYVKRNAI